MNEQRNHLPLHCHGVQGMAIDKWKLATCVNGAAIVFGLTAILLFCGDVAAAPNCKKGIPCGNSCIAANRVCHKTTDAAKAKEEAPAPSAASSATSQPGGGAAGTSNQAATAAGGEWVGSASDRVFLRAGCSASHDLAPSNRVQFPTEAAAIAAGFRRSKVPGC